MKTNGLTLRDVANLRDEIKNEIALKLRQNCDREKWYSAAELEELVDGLGSRFHFSNTFSMNFDPYDERTTYSSENRTLSFKVRRRERIRKCAYLNDEGEITGYFEIKDHNILEYKLV